MRGVDADGTRHQDDHGYADVPGTKPFTELQFARRLPTLNLALGDERPHGPGCDGRT